MARRSSSGREGCSTGLHDIDEGREADTSEPPVPAWLTVPEAPVVPLPPPREPRWFLILKFIAHGFLLYILSAIAGLIWSVVTIALVICGFIIGVIIALVGWLILYGYVNAYVTRWLWFPVDTGALRCFLHGLPLTLASLIPAGIVLFVATPLAPPGGGVQLPLLFFTIPLPILPVFVALVVLYAGLMGYLARGIASLWKSVPPSTGYLEEVPV